jgi:hypothetical protein
MLPFKWTQANAVEVNTIVFDFDMQEIESPGLALQISAIGTGMVLTPEFSSNETTWVAGWVEPITQNSETLASINAVGIYNIPKLTRFIRLRVSTNQTALTTTLSLTKGYAGFRAVTPVVGTQNHNATLTSGQAAHDAAVAGNPLRAGGRAVTANYTGVATNDTADLVTTVVGVLIEKPYSIPEADWTYSAAAGGITVATDVPVRAAQAAGIRNYCTAIQLRNANAVATEFVIKDGASVVLWRTQLPANMTGEFEVTFPTPLRTTAAAGYTQMNVQCVTTGAQVYANLQGYSAP